MPKRTLLCVLVLLGLALPVGAATPLAFSPEDILGWARERFQGETTYTLGNVGGQPVVIGSCDKSASGLYRDKDIDLSETPVIEWSWGIDQAFNPDADERQKGGDDFAVRLYVIHDGGLFFWRSRAINYVWSSNEPIGADWPNPYAAQSHMVVVDTGAPDAANPWRSHRRNMHEDFKKYHDLDLDLVDAIAIMTDCDDRKTGAKGWFGDIRLSAE